MNKLKNLTFTNDKLFPDKNELRKKGALHYGELTETTDITHLNLLNVSGDINPLPKKLKKKFTRIKRIMGINW